MSIWFDDVDVADLTAKGRGCINELIGLEITEATENSLVGRMPIDERTVQPAGVLHGGASVVLAETLASWAATMVIDRSQYHAVGQEINANHVRPAPAGTWVYGTATPASIGRRSQVWDIRIHNEEGKLVCVSRCTMAVIDMPSQYVNADQRG